MTNAPADPRPEDYAAKPKSKFRSFLLYAIIAVGVLAYALTQFAIYTIPENDAATEGVAFVVKQVPGMPLFESPDAYCIRKFNNSNRLCRSDALSALNATKIYFEIPYVKWMYQVSTGGRYFP